MGAIKKGLTQTDSIGLNRYLMSYSKAALADLVIDLVRRGGGEALDGRTLAVAIAEAAAPVMLARGDTSPNPDAYAVELERWGKRDRRAEIQQRIADSLAGWRDS